MSVDPRAVRSLPPERWRYWPAPPADAFLARARASEHYGHIQGLPDAPRNVRAYCAICNQMFTRDDVYRHHRWTEKSTLTECVPLPPRPPRHHRRGNA